METKWNALLLDVKRLKMKADILHDLFSLAQVANGEDTVNCDMGPPKNKNNNKRKQQQQKHTLKQS